MTEVVLGIDTSNYRTSLAAVDPEGNILINIRKLLPVQQGGRGLRQSDAVFLHLRQLTLAEDALRLLRRDGYKPSAIAVSDRPRDGEDSYMPVFQAGITAAVMIAGALDIPLYRTTHQRGHLAAAAKGTVLEGREKYLAVHLSGGTTDLLAVQPDRIDRLGSSLDLHAGQLVDRVGVSMGLSFPAGPELETLALGGTSEGRLGASMADGDLSCHLSGAESQAQRWIQDKTVSRADCAREIYDVLARTVSRMISAGSRKTGLREVLVTGGVAGSELFREMLAERCSRLRGTPEPFFGDRALSGDNAVGVALTGLQRLTRGC